MACAVLCIARVCFYLVLFIFVLFFFLLLLLLNCIVIQLKMDVIVFYPYAAAAVVAVHSRTELHIVFFFAHIDWWLNSFKMVIQMGMMGMGRWWMRGCVNGGIILIWNCSNTHDKYHMNVELLLIHQTILHCIEIFASIKLILYAHWTHIHMPSYHRKAKHSVRKWHQRQ